MSIDTLEDEREVVRVAVIGVGSAGLGQLKQLVDAFNRPDVRATKRLVLVGYEARPDVGGIWNHDPHPERFVLRHLRDARGAEKTVMYPPKDENPTAIYDGLQSLTPHEIMAFRELTFPKGTDPFPPGTEVCDYLKAYADVFDLRRHVRFSTRVERLYKSSSEDRLPRWVVESRSGGSGDTRVDRFDYVSVCNGHYNDPWIPTMPGLRHFPGQILHSREFRRATDYAGKTVLVIGSFSSGSDISRLLANLNIGHYTPNGTRLPPPDDQEPTSPLSHGFTKVYQSTTGLLHRAYVEDPQTPFHGYITKLPLIHHFEPSSPSYPKGRVHFKGDPQPAHPPLTDVDLVIFCTGYSNCLPFIKAGDLPWKENRVLEEVISGEEREGGDEWEVGGLRGLCMSGLDPMLIFLQQDRSLGFIGLPYSIIPFPFSEVQSRLTAYLWAGLLPSLPATLTPPLNTYNQYFDPITKTPAFAADAAVPSPPPDQPPPPPGSSADSPLHPQPPRGEAVAKIRQSLLNRREFVFPHPYEWEYTEYVFSLLQAAEDRLDALQAGDKGGAPLSAHWRAVEPWRREIRGDEGLRKSVLGY